MAGPRPAAHPLPRGCRAAPAAPRAFAPAAARQRAPRRQRCAAARAAAGGEVVLPNGLAIRHVSTPDEALFFWREHFGDRVYLKNGVALGAGGCVVDVGANVGLFAMAAAEAVGASGRVICFEPVPAAAAACRENARRHAAWCAARGVGAAPVTVVEAAVGAAEGEAVFTVYERSSGWSSMAPDGEETAANMTAFVEARLEALQRQSRDGGGSSSINGSGSSSSENGSGSSGSGEQAALTVEEPVGLVERLLLPLAAGLQQQPWARGALRALIRGYIRAVLMGTARSVRCRVTPLGAALRDLGFDGRISLLKIDVERAELEVLRGIGEADWPRIDQVALEAHDAGGALAEVRRTLAGPAGFGAVAVEQDPQLAGTSLYNVYATRRGAV
ncbi:hypothetical protein Rsub_05670 [Raphidocelis subcapitata]|uniref:Methyltransferase FkbM domain-containing protein n=1 Tax=Raphidocelis subcapitata TaxID=307507 RepID=A0A2V0P0F7_9CHLO|nr:hypothetical protein Rsub_05670 [Raphidocelis subcapitata]|eukprot:GBF93059.1 hypothetical protein Rsub_05670 [Raphidocelis subcapitata]